MRRAERVWLYRVLSVAVGKTAAARLGDRVRAVARTFQSWRRNILIPRIRHTRRIILYHKNPHRGTYRGTIKQTGLVAVYCVGLMTPSAKHQLTKFLYLCRTQLMISYFVYRDDLLVKSFHLSANSYCTIQIINTNTYT